MKKFLFLLAMLVQFVCAEDYPKPNQEDARPVYLDRVTFELGEESRQDITKKAGLWALAGGVIGALAGGYASNRATDRHESRSLLSRIEVDLVPACVIAGIAYLVAEWQTVNNTPEKRAEAEINKCIERNNDACDNHTRVHMNASQRSELKQLIAKGTTAPEARTAVYGYALDLRQQQWPVENCRYKPSPLLIMTATNYLAEQASKLQRERESAECMDTEWAVLKFSQDQKAQAESIRKNIYENKQRILTSNGLLPFEVLDHWKEEVQRLPEFITEDQKGSFDRAYENLKNFEREMKEKLEGLAFCRSFFEWLDKHQSSNDDAIKNITKISAYRDAIKNIKDDINTMMQAYQEQIKIYNAQVSEHAHRRAEIPGAVKSFIIQRSGRTSDCTSYPVNKRLLDYGAYLDRDSSTLHAWIRSCFE